MEAQRPQSDRQIAPSRPARPLILGAGIAGAAIAHALAQRGAAPIVIGAGAKPADGASGNPLGLVTPR
ncbi:FAD-dependent oxidoreductase, partial [Salmonella enterica]|uniref:FAD-dependent oxidoreductase n=1 Tax=Salmonella enterica TaxID=28901 RepID=UPI003CEC30CE